MGRFVVALGTLAACYGPRPQAGARCTSDGQCPSPLVCRQATMTCETTDEPADAAQADISDAVASHLHTAPGWTIDVLVDFTGVVPYNAHDFPDTTDIRDNQANAVAALYAPFAGSLAVAAGRSIIELDAAGHATVHDYRPAAPNAAGPDGIHGLTFFTASDPGPALWVTAASTGSGDGLYYITPDWKLTREVIANNVAGVAFDPNGDFDGTNMPTLYFIDQTGIKQEIGLNPATVIVPGQSDYDRLAVSAKALYTIHVLELDRIAPTTHAAEKIDTATMDFDVIDNGALGASVFAIKDRAQLVHYAGDNTPTIGAWSDDPAWFWSEAALVAPPHPLAGKIVVVESNRTLNVDRLLVVTTP